MTVTDPPYERLPARHARLPERRPLHHVLVQFPVVSFTLALLTDLAFWRTSNLMWQNFSAWLLFAGLVFGGLALLVGIVEAVYRMAIGGDAPAWAPAIAGLVVLGLALLNSFVHACDGWTAVVPYGLALSAATVVVMIVAALVARRPAARDDVEYAR